MFPPTSRASLAACVVACLAIAHPGTRPGIAAAEIQVPGVHATIQSAIDAAQPGDEVVVAPGVYSLTAAIDFRGKAITVRARRLPGDLSPVLRQTRAGTTVSCVVLFDSDETADSVLDGFTLTEGVGPIDPSDDSSFHGGGILCRDGANPTIRNCRIRGNFCQLRGGGVACIASSPTFETCVIEENEGRFGAGVYLFDSGATFTGCVFQANFYSLADSDGGGIYCYQSTPTFTDCTIQYNSASRGGGVFCHSSSVGFTDCRIRVNIAIAGSGGGLYSEDSAPGLSRCVIEKNRAVERGAGVYFTGSRGIVVPSLYSCRILENWAQGDGGGIYCTNSSTIHRHSPFVRNCVIAGNLALGSGAAIAASGTAGPLVVNATIVGNQADSGPVLACASLGSTQPSFLNCLLWENSSDAFCGVVSHNLAGVDPLFVAGGEYDFNRLESYEIGGVTYGMPDFIASTPDFHLGEGSPAIDSGAASGAPIEDIDGTPRPCGAAVDIGAHERCSSRRFRRGDPNLDGAVDISDAVTILGYLFLGAPTTLDCEKSADSDDNGRVELTDAVRILGFLFTGGAPPAAPFPDAGVDPTEDDLGCEVYPAS